MLPLRAEPAPRGPTPRAQLTRVVVAGAAALVLGAGPAVAWDLSTQPPPAEPRSSWPKPSPWLAAGKQMKTAAKDIARVYLPKDPTAPAVSAEPATGVAVPSPAAAATPGTTVPIPTLAPPPHRYISRAYIVSGP